MASMDMDGFERLKKFKNNTGHPHYKKYFNMNYWLRKNMQRALFLGVNRTQKRMKILDIGAGFGYFPFVSSFFGHDVVGVDLPGDQLFEEAARFLEVERKHHEIKAMEKLPDLGGKFDMITAFQVCFNDHYEDKPWGMAEWTFFLDDVLDNQLNPGGKLYMEFNFHHTIGGWLPEEVKTLFKDKYKARFDGLSRVTITKKG